MWMYLGDCNSRFTSGLNKGQYTSKRNLEEADMAKEELLREFGNIIDEFLKTHTDELKQFVNWGKMPNGMVFGQADISSNDFVLILLRTFRDAGARIIDSGVWQPFPNFAFPINLTLDKLHAEETVDWNAELGGN
jgi:hypothetical protein